MKKLIMCIGIPGCGKSTWCKTQTKDGNTIVISSDNIRERIYGDESEQGDPNHVFAVAKDDVINGFKHYDFVILDATNTTKKNRIHFIKSVKSQLPTVEVGAVWFAVPINVCKERNLKRKRVVPEYVIDKMYMNFCPPGYEEGFDTIQINLCKSANQMNIDTFLNFADSYDQQNPHHTLTLGQHVRKACEYVKNNGGRYLLQVAALLHDIGKIYTATNKNSKGEITEVMHYYQHHCVGAYEIPFFLDNNNTTNSNTTWINNLSCNDVVYIANLIYYHMHPLREWKSEKKRKKDEALFSKEFLEDLMLLHDGDLIAH